MQPIGAGNVSDGSIVITIKLLFLGPARDLAHADDSLIELTDGATVADLRMELAKRHADLARALPTCRFAVNEEFARDNRKLSSGDEVALIPPVSGGTSRAEVWTDLVNGPIPLDRVRRFITGDSTLGGIVTFEGVTRADVDTDHGCVQRLEYEAYEPMASKRLECLAEQAVERWALGRVAMVHRVGAVPPAEPSVVIAVASGHRAEAFEACRWLIDTLKEEVPIWKKDVFEDGHTRWVDPNGKTGDPACLPGATTSPTEGGDR